MNRHSLKKNVFLYIFMVLLGIGLVFVSSPKARSQGSDLTSPLTATASISVQSITNTIFINAAPNGGELTGDMLVKFDADPSPYPGNYDYYFDGSDTFEDIKAYIYTPEHVTTNCPVQGEAIYNFTINSQGIYKVQEYVWAKDYGHDSFFVEIKKGDERIPFPASTTNPSGDVVWVKKAHDRFELNGQHNQWHWKDVCHWNAYVGPKEIANTCYYFLSPADYKIIYSTREKMTRLASIRIVKVFSLPLPIDTANQQQSELDQLKDYFQTQVQEKGIATPPQLTETEAEADWLDK